MHTLLLTTFVFAWPAQHFTVKVTAATWDIAYAQAVDFCVTAVRANNPSVDNETLIDICANPK